MAAPIPTPSRPLVRRAALVAAAAAVVVVSVLAAGPGASAAGPKVTVSPNVDVSDKRARREVDGRIGLAHPSVAA